MNKSKFSSKVIASILSLMMVISIFPLSGNVYAATAEHPDAVTITVVDDKGQPIKDASVVFVVDSVANGDAYISETKKTDETGVVEVMVSDAFVADDLTISATVTADGYEGGELPETAIESSDANFDVTLKDITIRDVDITPKTLTYNGKAQELVSVTEVEGDTVEYYYPSDSATPSNKVPEETNAGEYNVRVVVKREGKNNLDKTVTAKIEKAEITDISIEAIEGLKYNEKKQKLVKLNGSFNESDVITWTIGSDIETGTAIPERTAIGTYSVKLTVDRGANYNLYEQEVTAEIAMGEINLGSLKIEANSLTYNGEDQEALKVTDKGNDYKLLYQFAESEEKLADDKWVELTDDDKPMVKNAGTYTIYIKAIKDANYNDKKTEAYPVSVTVEKAEQIIEFVNYESKGSSTISLNASDATQNVYDFVAQGGKTDEPILYAVENASNDTVELSKVATITEDGKLNVLAAGAIKIVATKAGNDNYKNATVEYVLVITQNSNLAHFEHSNLSYCFGENDGKLTEQKLIIDNEKDNGKVTYDINEEYNSFLKVDNVGKVTITDYNKMAEVLNSAENKKIVVIVTAQKAPGTKTVTKFVEKTTSFGAPYWVLEDVTDIIYEGTSLSYTIAVSLAEAPKNAYTITETPNEAGWFNAGVTVVPAEGYKIAKSAGGSFDDSVFFDDQGENNRYIYLKNIETGAITDKIAVVNAQNENLKIDTVNPVNLSIEYSETTLKEKIGQALGFYNPDITITFAAEDITSGVKKFIWTYKPENGETISEELTDISIDGNKATASITLPANDAEQLHGKISFVAIDKASNEIGKDGDYTFIVDTISPELNVKYQGKAPYEAAVDSYNGAHFFSDDVTVELTITETNFYSDDVTVKVSKDGKEAEKVKVSWKDSVGTFTLKGDGDYVLYVTYTDKSANRMEPYNSEVITIDKTAPRVKIDYVHEGDIQKTIFTVTEHNFRASDVVITGTMKDINGEDVGFTAAELTDILNNADWTQSGDVYTYEYDQYVNGIYNLNMDYRDIAGWDATQEVEDEFIIDHAAPTVPEIEYITTPWDTFINAISFGYYNPSVTVRFTSYDTSSGVESFTWGYTKEPGASVINHPEALDEDIVTAMQDESDKSKFTAEITLTADEANQYRGYLSVLATDTFGNNSDKIDDNGNIIVVDTVAPEMTVEYTVADRVIDSDYYYNNAIDVKFTVTEANFYPEDIKVTVTKNGEVFDFGDITWGEKDEEDKSIGIFTLNASEDHSDDGHYVITVEYTDRSNNEMVKYVSDIHTIDTTAPVINVEYQNTEVKNTLKDSEDKDRDYFDKTQTAVVTIEEHNFASDEVEFSIVAKDVTGAELDAETLHNKSEWTVDSTGDIHTITITYSGDANYTFDAAYTDKATNAAEDYAEDYFTVDKNAPELGVVVYDPEFKEVVLNAITFGFYKEKVTVTLTATDPISEVHSFLYSYLNADGVSSVNAELIKQVIEAADIKYSENRDIATTTFEIPKAALGDDNQFNGTVEFTATDRAGNESVTHKEKNRVVVDNIVPTAKVIYSEAINTEGKISYYDGDIDVTIKVTEANFYSKDVKVKVSKDGKETNISRDVKWKDNSVDEHTGTFTLTEDGDYIVTIEYSDKSGNVMKTYKSEQLTIDTDIKAPTLSINGVGHSGDSGAYNKDVTVSYSFEDVNYDTNNIRLTRTKFDTVEDVTSEFVGTNITADGGSGSFQIPSKVANDGIYTLTVNMADKANHTTESRMTFTVNRYGSVYVYDNYLASLIKDGGQFITIKGDNKVAITEDLIINEYNACELKKDSLKILITRDGEVVDADYTWKQVNGNSGWYQYAYTIDAENFKEDGVYKISLSSKYNTVDSEDNESTSVPENSFKTNGEEIIDTMSFVVDTKAPEIRNVINLDKKVADKDAIKDGKLTVKYTVIDIGGLKSIQIIVNGEKLDEITKFGDDQYNYSGEFIINEDSKEQTVQIIVTDKAGNVTDTSAKDFSTGEVYVFNGSVTVSSSVFDRIIANVRIFFESWYANKPLFWGSIAGVVVVAGGIWFIVIAKKKKKKEDA